MKEPLLDQADLERISSQITAAEEGSSGEVVPFVVARSDNYEAVIWRGAAASGAVFLLVTLLVYVFYEGWSLGWLYTGIGLAFGLVLAFLLGIVTTLTSDRFFRFMAGRDLLARRCRARANRAFIEERIYETRDRTGILIFVSLRERRIEVVADGGISAVVDDGSWENVVAEVRQGLQRHDLAGALLAGVGLCGEILRGSGLKARPDDPNELRDELRISES